MTKSHAHPTPHLWHNSAVGPGEAQDVHLDVSESYSGITVRIPLHVRRGLKDGPTLFVSAALHGDEINGTGAVRDLIQDETLHLQAGMLILIPVLNVLSFDQHSRYLPDRRDLNRCFPGDAKGTMASRMATVIFSEIVSRCDFGIDLHTAAVRRTNFPNVRGDLSDPRISQLAKAFGCEFLLDGRGPKGSLRREACRRGCPVILFEGGEVWKVEPTIVSTAIRGVRNVLAKLGMTDETPVRPAFQSIIKQKRWVRAERGGFLQFHVAPGTIVSEGQALASNTTLLGRDKSTLTSPFDGVILGMSTLPSVSPGEPVCHIGRIDKNLAKYRSVEDALDDDHPHSQALGDLASNITVVERDPLTSGDDG